jgi:hypothetical protein
LMNIFDVGREIILSREFFPAFASVIDNSFDDWMSSLHMSYKMILFCVGQKTIRCIALKSSFF